jgi:hypothetical protein
VTDSDDLWIGMAQFDTGLADGLWEGLPPPGDAPDWYGKVSALIHAASAPAGRSDLAGEASIVARMQAAVVDAAANPPRAIDLRHAVVRRRAVDSPRHLAARRRAAQHEQGHGARLVGRIVAVKAVALTTAVVLGVTAAAATTGIVATVVVPALQDRDQPTDKELPAIEWVGVSGWLRRHLAARLRRGSRDLRARRRRVGRRRSGPGCDRRSGRRRHRVRRGRERPHR